MSLSWKKKIEDETLSLRLINTKSGWTAAHCYTLLYHIPDICLCHKVTLLHWLTICSVRAHRSVPIHWEEISQNEFLPPPANNPDFEYSCTYVGFSVSKMIHICVQIVPAMTGWVPYSSITLLSLLTNQESCELNSISYSR